MKSFSLNALGLVVLATHAAEAWWFDPETCHLPIDTMFLQDTTGSFIEDLPLVLKQLPTMVSEIQSGFPGSKFAVAEFKDKPYYPWGIADDFCYKLGYGGFTDDIEIFSYAYSLLYASGGADLPEATYQALINAALDVSAGWRPLAQPGTTAGDGEAGARTIILSTDALPHLPMDALKYNATLYPEIPRNLPPSRGLAGGADIKQGCLFEDYPSPAQAKEALAAANVRLIILTPEDDPAVVAGWKWVNEELLGQHPDFYQIIKSDSSDLLEGALNALKKVTEIECEKITTTPAPTTAPTTSTTATTKPPRTTAPTGLTTTADCPPENPCNEGLIIHINQNVKEAHILVKA